MSNMQRWIIWSAALAFLLPGIARAVPSQIPYRGSLTGADGTPVNTAVTVEVGLYAEAEGGAPVWGPAVYSNVQVQDGQLSLVLGAPPGEPVEPEAIGGDSLWLDFIVDGQPLEPRQEVLSVPFALRSGDAGQLGGVDAEEFLTFDDLDNDTFVRTHQVGEAAQTNQYEDLDGLPDLSGVLRADGTVPLQAAWNMGGKSVTGLVIGGGEEPPEAASSGALWFDSLTGALAVHDGLAWRVLDNVAQDLTCSGCVELDALGFQLSLVAQTGIWSDLEGAPLLTDYLRTDGSSAMTGSLDLGGHALVQARIEEVPTSASLSPTAGRLVLNQATGRLEMGDGGQWIPVSGALNADGSLSVSTATVTEELHVDGSLSVPSLTVTEVEVQESLLVAGVNLGEAVSSLQYELTLANTALQVAEGERWCLTHCAPSANPCNALTCDGDAETCQVGGTTNEGEPCGGGLGVCHSGACCAPKTCAELGVACGQTDDACGGALSCDGCGEDELCDQGTCGWNGTTCGGVTCPQITGYAHLCNAQDHCEYAPRVQFEPWQSHDVWLHVPPGTYPMGQTEIDPVAFLWNLPSHEVSLAQGYLLGRFEVTVATYEACEADGACPPAQVDPSDLTVDDFGLSRSSNGRAHHPQNGLSRDRAAAVCAWLGGRLPSEAEWEYAATGTTHVIYPWGDTPPPSCAAGNGAFGLQEGDQGLGAGAHGCGSDSTYPVGSAPAGRSRRGADDMAGNLFEWTQDCWHSSYEGAPTDGSAWLDGCDGDDGVVRGSDYRRGPALSALGIRVERDPHEAGAHVGVRCVRDL